MNGNDKRPLAPRMRFPEFREDGEWQEKEIAKFLTESRIEGGAGDTAKKITVKLWGKGVFAKNESIKGSENTRYYKRKAGQFIYSKLDFLNQAFGLIPEYLDGFESTVDLPCFDIGEELEPVFLLEYVKRDDFYKKNGEIADGGRKAKRIQTEVFLSFPIALPAQKAEQQKIAECLASLDELIAAETKKLDALKTHKKGLMQQSFPREGETVPRLRFPEFRDAGAWEELTVAGVCKINPSRAYKQDDELVSFIPMAAVSEDGRIEHPEVRNYAEVKKGYTAFVENDVIVAKITPCFENGKAALAKNLKNGAGFGSTEFHVFRAGKSCLPEFLFLQLYREDVRAAGARSMVGNAGQRRVPVSFFEAFPFYLPTIEEQQALVDFLFSFDDLITAQAQKIEALKTHKRSLMQQLFPVFDEVSA